MNKFEKTPPTWNEIFNFEMVELTGSEKQIAWATDIRNEAYATLTHQHIIWCRDGLVSEMINRHTSAKWWIDYRDAASTRIAIKISKEILAAEAEAKNK